MVYNLPGDDCQSYLMNGMFDHPPTESNGYVAPHFGNIVDALVLELQTTCDFLIGNCCTYGRRGWGDMHPAHSPYPLHI